jgi:hypothetical protein
MLILLLSFDTVWRCIVGATGVEKYFILPCPLGLEASHNILILNVEVVCFPKRRKNTQHPHSTLEMTVLYFYHTYVLDATWITRLNFYYVAYSNVSHHSY